MPGDGNEAVRHKEAQDRKRDYDATTDPSPEGLGGDLDAVPGPGGYAGRDPQTEMPRVPSVPETQDDPGTHDGAPSGGDRPAHS